MAPRFVRTLVLALALLPCTAARLVDVRSARHDDFTRIVFETDEKVSYAIENRSLGSERAIELSLPASAGEMIVRAVHEPAISVQVKTTGSGTRALVRVSGPVDVWTNQLGNPPRVVLDLRVAEPVAGLDPEQLDALDYQIVVEADPEAPQRRAQVSAPAPPAAEAPVEPTSVEGPTGWARSTPLWWALAALAVAFLVVLWAQRISQRRRREERVPPPASRAQPTPKASVAPAAPGEAIAVVKPTSPGEAIGVAKEPPSSPAAAEEPPAPPVAAPAKPPRPTPAESPDPTPGRARDASAQLFEILSRMEERLAVLERELRDTRAESRELHERSAAHAEELRAHRVAVARLLRRPVRARPSGDPRSGPDPSSNARSPRSSSSSSNPSSSSSS